MTEPLVSVFIRVRDEAAALQDVLQALAEQVIDAATEIVVLDNESEDDSAKVALAAGARVFSLPRQCFGYGRALNLGVALCRGEIMVLLSAHSIPQSASWLAELVAPIMGGAATAAFCRQVPVPPVSRLELRRFKCFPESDVLLDRATFLTLCHEGRDPYEVGIFSNSACAIERDVVEKLPFRDLPYAEDRCFAVDSLMAHGRIKYLSGPAVSYHRPATWRSVYRIGYRAQVSKRLIRELAATYTGRRYDSRRETLSRLTRCALVVPGAIFRVTLCAREPRGTRRQAVGFVLKSTGSTMGLAKGTLLWRRHSESLSVDTAGYQSARQHCHELTLS
jgi:glycosyltransferase involved in cell wall biosynthesis